MFILVLLVFRVEILDMRIKKYEMVLNLYYLYWARILKFELSNRESVA